MKRTLCISAAAAVLLALSACTATPTSNVDNIPPAAQTQENHSAPAELDGPENAASDIPASKTTLTVTAGGQGFTVTLADNESARRLVNLLPLTLDMSELNGNEKYFYLDTELPADPYQPGQINAGFGSVPALACHPLCRQCEAVGGRPVLHGISGRLRPGRISIPGRREQRHGGGRLCDRAPVPRLG